MTAKNLMRNSNERGIAMITTLLVLMLMAALLVGFTTVVMSDQRYRFIDRDRGQAFYAASAGI
jgi:Tfp pilus assembly protein PilX